MVFTISDIKPSEVPALLVLICELAKFERLEQEVEATVESLDKALFGDPPAVRALLARYNGEAVGYALYFFTFSSFVGRAGLWLDDVYVKPAFRQQGLGKKLIEEVARIGAERNCGRFEWTALNWNKTALDFYTRLGAQVMEDWVLLRLNSTGLRRLAGAGE